MGDQKVKCAICEDIVDRGACNQEFTIITIVRDTDATGTKKIRKYLCEYHASHLHLWISTEAFKVYEENHPDVGA